MSAEIISFPNRKDKDEPNGELSIEKTLRITKCRHNSLKILSEDNPYVECRDCGEKISSTSVLARMASEATRLSRLKAEYSDALKQYENRKKFTCKVCNKVQFIN